MLFDFKDTLSLRCSNSSDVENTDCVTNIENFFLEWCTVFRIQAAVKSFMTKRGDTSYHATITLLGVDFLKQTIRMSPTIHHQKHITNVYSNTAS